MTERSGPARRGLPLFWKLLAPFATLIVIGGSVGMFVIVRDLTSRAQATLQQDLLQASLEVGATVQGRELYLLEAVNLAANLAGMADAVQAGDPDAVGRLSGSVLALKDELDLLVVTRADGTGIVEYTRGDSDAELQQDRGTRWAPHQPVAAASAGGGEDRYAGVLDMPGGPVLVVAAPICERTEGCEVVGTAVVGISLEQLVAATADAALGRGVALFDDDGTVLATAGSAPARPVDIELDGDALVRRTEDVDGAEVHTLYSPFELQGQRQGLVGVSLPTEPVFAPAQAATLRLVLLLLAGLAGIVGIGALLARAILRQVRSLVATNRALGAGDLSARASVVSGDEIGEVARGLNQMADQLQASYKTLESRVAQRTQEVERLLRERTDFFASLSHELRTPLAVILTEAALLPGAPRKGVAEASRAIEGSASQLLAVVNGILEVAEAEAGSLELYLQTVRVDDAIGALRRTIEGLARGAGIETVIDVPRHLPAVEADPVRLGEILLNLADNAIKYTPHGGRVTISATSTDHHVAVSVSDTGPGIPDDVGERIFEPFYRVAGTKAQHGRKASGLGLALTRQLVEAHGGTIDYISTPGGGTTFMFSLPIAETPADLRPVGHRTSLGR